MWGWHYFLEFSTLFLETFNFGSPSHSSIFDSTSQIPLQVETSLTAAPLLRTSGTCQDPNFRKKLPYSGQVCSYDTTGGPNTPTTRNGWCDGVDICTDYENVGNYPKNGCASKVREYWLEIAYGVIHPDGYKKEAMLINGRYPGPLIEAWWGDIVVIHVTNKLPNNGTALHGHGLRQWFSVGQDGVPGVTQCPIAPGDTMTYTWGNHSGLPLMQYGHSWYHSHLSLQYPNGIAGPVLIHGPTSANWDIDLGPILITDWLHTNAFEMYHTELSSRVQGESILINGRGVFECDPKNDTRCVGDGKYWETTFTPGKTHLMRFVNTATNSHFRVSLDGHKLLVVAMDFVPIKPFWADYIDIGIGQRYEVVVKADAKIGNYWLRTQPQKSCSPVTDNARKHALGIIRYRGSNKAKNPTSESLLPPNEDFCRDEPLVNLIPMTTRGDKIHRSILNTSETFEVSLAPYIPGPPDTPGPGYNASNFAMWRITDYSLWLNWSDPVVRDVYRNPHLTSANFPQAYAIINEKIDKPGVEKWAIFHIEGKYNSTIKNDFNVTHPIHLHGHDFVVLAQGEGDFDPNTIPIVTENPTRRDVALLPGDGYLVIAFKLDNPGVWLLHCHIAWHASQGLGLLVLEAQSEIPSTLDNYGQMQTTCANWDWWSKYSRPPPAHKEDSGV